jgi:threonine/homoserine/homoserine lactone efflux protein
MDNFLVFLISLLASLLGSLQAGLVNTSVLHTTWQVSTKAGKQMAVGGAVPEIIYACIACLFTHWIMETFTSFSIWFAIVSGILIIGIGLYFIFGIKLTIKDKSVESSTKNYFLRGFTLGMVNPQLLLFWSGIRIAISGLGISFVGWPAIVSFSLGAGFGAWILLYGIVLLAHKIRFMLNEKSMQWVYRVIGIVLMLSGLWVLLKALLPKS